MLRHTPLRTELSGGRRGDGIIGDQPSTVTACPRRAKPLDGRSGQTLQQILATPIVGRLCGSQSQMYDSVVILSRFRGSVATFACTVNTGAVRRVQHGCESRRTGISPDVLSLCEFQFGCHILKYNDRRVSRGTQQIDGATASRVISELGFRFIAA